MAAPASLNPTSTLPTPEPSDSESVRESLLSARIELERGEPSEALRLLRRAAEASDAAGDDLRSLALARAAADLANELGTAQPARASQAPSVSVPASASPASASPASASPASASPAKPVLSPVAAPSPPVADDLRELIESGRALRVVVKRSVRDDELYVVRRSIGGKVMPDAREAVIVLLEPDADFFSAK